MTDISRTFIHQSTSNSNEATLTDLTNEDRLEELLKKVPMASQGFHFGEPSVSGKIKPSTNKPKIVPQVYLDIVKKRVDSGDSIGQALLGDMYRTGAYTVEAI